MSLENKEKLNKLLKEVDKIKTSLQTINTTTKAIQSTVAKSSHKDEADAKELTEEEVFQKDIYKYLDSLENENPAILASIQDGKADFKAFANECVE